MRKFIIAVLTALMLAGCPSVPINSVDAQRNVYATREAYVIALREAVKYESMPRCTAAAPTPSLKCSDPAIVAQIRKADTVAVAALDAAEAAVRTPQIGTDASSRAVQTASSAFAAFNALIIPLMGLLK